MLTILDLEAIGLEAEAQAQEFEAEFLRNFNAPLVRIQAALQALQEQESQDYGDVR